MFKLLNLKALWPESYAKFTKILHEMLTHKVRCPTTQSTVLLIGPYGVLILIKRGLHIQYGSLGIRIVRIGKHLPLATGMKAPLENLIAQEHIEILINSRSESGYVRPSFLCVSDKDF